MKKYKKLTSLFLALVFTVSIVGCSSTAPTTPSQSSTATQAPAAVTQNPAATNQAPAAPAEPEIQLTETSVNGNSIVSSIPIQFPLPGTPYELKIMSINDRTDWEEVLMWSEYEKLSGVKTNLVKVAVGERNEKMSTALASGEYYDLFLKGGLSAQTLVEYGDQGLLFDMMEDNYLESYAPNVYNYFQNHLDSMAGALNPDGTMYGLPQINSGAELRVSRKLFINKNWLERVGMGLPTTTDELYELLVAFKEQDANGNGDPTDEIPFCTQDWAGFQDVLLGAFGLGNRGQHNQIVDWDEVNNVPRLIAASDDYKDMLQYMNKLYTEGLVDQELFTMTSANWTTKAADDRIGMFAFTNLSSVPGNQSENWVGIEEAIEGPNGHKLWTACRANFHSTGNAVIPSNSKMAKEALQWIDFFWTDAGTLFYHYGIENESYVANPDGTYDYAPYLYDQMAAGSSFDDIVSQITIYPGGRNPTVEVAPYFGGGEMAPIPAKTALLLFEYKPEIIWPSFTFTLKESTDLTAIQTDIRKYYESARTEFITGTKSFSEWDAYKSAMENMNLSKMLEIYGAAIGRYDELVKNN